MKIFETTSQMSLSQLSAGQLVECKGTSFAGDGKGYKYLIAPQGTSAGPDDVILANGTVAILQRSFVKADFLGEEIRGTLVSTNDTDGSNITISTSSKNPDEYAVEIIRSGTTVGGIRVDGRIDGGGGGGDYFEKSEYIDESTGAPDAGKPIILNDSGKVDPSMMDIQAFEYQGSWNPSAGTEYPDTTGVGYGSFWMIDGLSAPYTFTGGDLAGETYDNGDLMIWGESGWTGHSADLDPTAYYRLDGTTPIIANFAAGGFKLVNVADGTDSTDAVTKAQLDTKLDIGGKSADSELLDGIDSSQFVRNDVSDQTIRHMLNVEGLSDSTYAILKFKAGDAQANEGIFRMYSSNGLFHMDTEDDAGAAGSSFLHVRRSENSVSSITLTAPSVEIAGSQYITGSQYIRNDSVSLLGLQNSNGTGRGIVGFTGAGGPLYIRKYKDADPSTVAGEISIHDDGHVYFSNKRIKNLAEGVDPSDAATVSQLSSGGIDPTEFYKLDGSQPLTAALQANGNKLSAISNGTAVDDAVNLGQLQLYVPLDGSVPMTGDLNTNAIYCNGIVVSGDIEVEDIEVHRMIHLSNDVSSVSSLYIETSSKDGTSYVINVDRGGSTVSFISAEGGMYGQDIIANTSFVCNGAMTVGGISDFSGNKITNLADGTAATDAATFGQVSALSARISALENA